MRNELACLADSHADIEARVQRCKQLVKRRALVAAGVAALPIPGLDWLTDISVLLRVLPEINRIFGLSEQQVAQLLPERRVLLYRAISGVGSILIGKVITHTMVWHLLRTMGVRLTTQQVAKFIPLLGQTTSAALTFFALQKVCAHHIAQCASVSTQFLSVSPDFAVKP
jgi:hypothetical protein